MSDTAVKDKKTKPELLNDIDALEKITEDLENQISDLNRRRVSLENQVASLDYQVKNERGEVLQKANIEAQEKLRALVNFENNLKSREKIIQEKEDRLSERRAEFEKGEAVLADIKRQTEKMYDDRVLIEKMRYGAETLMAQANSKMAEAEGMVNGVRSEKVVLDKREKDLKDLQAEVERSLSETHNERKALESRIAYYEELASYIKASVSEKQKEDK